MFFPLLNISSSPYPLIIIFFFFFFFFLNSSKMVFSGNTDQNPTCDTGLGLALCGRRERPNQENIKKNITLLASLRYHDHLLPSDLSLGLLSQDRLNVNQINPVSADDHAASIGDDYDQMKQNQRRSSLSTGGGVSSFSNSNSVKKEMREYYNSGSEQVEVENINSCSRVSSDEHEDQNHDQEDGSPRKKLRLSKQQAVILEDSFKDHTTLNPKQKQALAEQLNLRPRQVEVWFQNRRARTKLKKTEMDFELLKKCCETLKEENKRLQKDVQELKSLKLTASFYMQLPAATLMTMCPSCERLGSSSHGGDGSSGTPLIPISPKPHHFYNSFSHPSSAAC